MFRTGPGHQGFLVDSMPEYGRPARYPGVRAKVAVMAASSTAERVKHADIQHLLPLPAER